MKQYLVNKELSNNGDHEVHAEDCISLPLEENRHYLGSFSNCSEAVEKAKEIYHRANGCSHCAEECHTT